MTGTSTPSSYVNLANRTQTDIVIPTDTESIYSQNAFNTSLWSCSALTNGGKVNGLTVNMQAYDTIGPGTYYYNIRAGTDNTDLYFGNIRISATNFK
jgi:hypothetical protein